MHAGVLPQNNRLSTAIRHKPGDPVRGSALDQASSATRRAVRTAHKLPQRHTLKREISLALVAKLILLSALWFLFFSHPLDRSLGANDMDRVLLGPAAKQLVSKAGPAAGITAKESRHDP